MANRNHIYAETIEHNAIKRNLRTGQYLFNSLPREIRNVVAGTLWDPYHKDLNFREIKEWLDNHLIFQGNIIVGLFNNNDLLWTLPDPSSIQ